VSPTGGLPTVGMGDAKIGAHRRAKRPLPARKAKPDDGNAKVETEKAKVEQEPEETIDSP